jgi:hypothetical protein
VSHRKYEANSKRVLETTAWGVRVSYRGGEAHSISESESWPAGVGSRSRKDCDSLVDPVPVLREFPPPWQRCLDGTQFLLLDKSSIRR